MGGVAIVDEDDFDNIVELLRTFSCREIAEKWDTDSSVISTFAKNRGVNITELKKAHYLEVIPAELAKGTSKRDIAKLLRISSGTLTKYLTDAQKSKDTKIKEDQLPEIKRRLCTTSLNKLAPEYGIGPDAMAKYLAKHGIHSVALRADFQKRGMKEARMRGLNRKATARLLSVSIPTVTKLRKLYK